MAVRRKRWLTAASVAVVMAGGWFTYSLMARQGQGTLAQAPLNIQVAVPPAFLMALDDSGSMLWEMLNNTRDGVFRWVDSPGSNTYATGFYNTRTGEPHGFGDNGNNGENYYYNFPGFGRGTDSALPPFDSYGFARSPDVNSAYFDPRDSYPAWKNGAADPARSDFATIDPTSAPVDPRPAGSPGLSNTRVNLTQNLALAANGQRFTFRRGMVIPAGTLIETGRCGSTIFNSNVLSGVAGFSRANSDITVAAGDVSANNPRTCEAGISFYPATFFLTDRNSLPAGYGYKASAVTTLNNPLHGRPGITYKYEIRPANFDTTAQYNAAMQNFANWFSFYRTRREALIGGASNALHDSTNLRAGWFRINGRNTARMYDMSVEAEKKALIYDIQRNMTASGSTPNRSAAAHLGAQFQRVRSGSDPNPPVLLSCQKNAGMLFTDGYINEGTTSQTPRMRGSVAPYYDNSLVPSIDTYSVPVPQECKGSNPSPSLDCKTNLHMNFYGVVLGTLGDQFGVTYQPVANKPWILNPDPYVNRPTFSSSPQNLVPAAVDELWEAVLYTRGEMVNATKAGDITQAMRRIISNVSQGATPSGTRSLTGARVGVGSLAVEPFYEATNNGTDWYSRLSAYTLTVDQETRGITSTLAWEASTKMPAADSRNVWFWRAGAALRFNGTNVSLDNLCSKPAGLYPGMTICSVDELTGLAGTNAVAVSYLLGNTTKEARNGGVLRDRTTVLGDIINSTPVMTSPTDDFGYRALPAAMGTSYAGYLTAKRANRRYMVYAGGNDGMLHGFDGGMGADGRMDVNGGRELFGYVPSTAIGHMGNLLLPYDAQSGNNQRFDHRYFVDGPVVVGDTYTTTGWQTSLVGTSGAGGRSVFALDVTDPGAFNANKLLWELNDFDTELDQVVRDNIGFVLGKPVIVPVKAANGTISFKAIFGNGFESKSGKAALFIVDMAKNRRPTVSVRIAEETGQNLPAGNNGLGNIVVVDRWGGTDQTGRARDGFADTVYAADQKGAIWKFDLRNATAPARPLFTTRTSVDTDTRTYRQPITGGLTATAGASGGVMLFFGTGSFAYKEDGQDRSVQGLYGVNDIESGQPTVTLTAANLTPITVQTNDGIRRLTTGTPPQNSRGWTIALPAGERAVGNPAVTSGTVFMPTYVPNQTVGCSVDGSNWLFGLNTRTGAGALDQVRLGTPDGNSPGAGTAGVALATGGNAPVRDVTTAVVPRLLPPEKDENAAPPPPGSACVMQISVAGAPPMYLPYPCGRQSWRQIQ